MFPMLRSYSSASLVIMQDVIPTDNSVGITDAPSGASVYLTMPEKTLNNSDAFMCRWFTVTPCLYHAGGSNCLVTWLTGRYC